MPGRCHRHAQALQALKSASFNGCASYLVNGHLLEAFERTHLPLHDRQLGPAVANAAKCLGRSWIFLAIPLRFAHMLQPIILAQPGGRALGAYRHSCGLCAAIALLSASPAAAHPHVWATVRSEIVFDANHQITGVRHAWTFDEFYSAMAVQGLDTNGDGVFSAEELKPLAEVNVKSLKDFDYFTFVHIGDGDNLPLKPPENYSLDYDKGLLTLHFTLPLEKPLDTHRQGRWMSMSTTRPSSSPSASPPRRR